MRPYRFSCLVAIFSVLICVLRFGRCQSLEGNDGEATTGLNNEKAVQRETDSGSQNEEEESGSESWSEDETEEDLYFYRFDKESVVKEYKGPSDDEKKDEPGFLYHPLPGHIRIVEFYAHWCPHCSHFRPKYNAFAKKMKEIAARSNMKLDVYAISCVPHRELCRDQDIHGYPKVFLFAGENGKETEGVEIAHGDLHPFYVLQKISEKTGINGSAALDKIEVKEDHYHYEEKNEVGNDSFWIHRTKYDIYCDVYLSFHFAMQHGIFVGRDLPNEEKKEAFENWIGLLDQVLPPVFDWAPLHALVSDIGENIETVLDSEANLLEIVDRHPPPRKKWSQSCSRGDPMMGYTCGLWQLFHIATLGAVEWNRNSIGDDDNLFLNPGKVGQTLRSYVEHFFGCEVCRVNFLRDYDDCAFHRCERLSTEIGSLQDWKEIPFWLFEVHNGVNSRLMKERAERENREPTQEELTAVQWPARNDCPLCWHADGRFDVDAVYSFLQLTYWPDEILTANVLPNKGEEGVESWVYSLIGLVLASFLFTIVSWRAQKQREIERTGKHKKADDDDFV